MEEEMKLQLTGMDTSKKCMSSEEYQVFIEAFQESVKPVLDRQRKARIRSEEAAKRHLVT